MRLFYIDCYFDIIIESTKEADDSAFIIKVRVDTELPYCADYKFQVFLYRKMTFTKQSQLISASSFY